MDISREIIEKLYLEDKKNQTEISKILNISRTSVGNLLKKFNILKRKKSNKYYANENFFENWSSKMAYCLGFITADGHVWKDRPYLSIAINARDINVLNYLRDNISPSSIVRPYKNKTMAQLTIHCKKIWEDLKKYNITHDKTFNMKIDFDIPNKYIGDYVRGFFDGDGSIFSRNNKGKPYYWSSFVSASKQMLLDLKNLIKLGEVKSTHNGKYFVLEINQPDSLKLKELMYSNCVDITMLRKYDKFNLININYKFWSKEEDDIIRLNTNLSNKKISLLLPNRTFESIKARRSKLKCLHKKL